MWEASRNAQYNTGPVSTSGRQDAGGQRRGTDAGAAPAAPWAVALPRPLPPLLLGVRGSESWGCSGPRAGDPGSSASSSDESARSSSCDTTLASRPCRPAGGAGGGDTGRQAGGRAAVSAGCRACLLQQRARLGMQPVGAASLEAAARRRRAAGGGATQRSRRPGAARGA